ncbi:MAG: DUF6265 family protein [Pseudomonadota bacterium]
MGNSDKRLALGALSLTFSILNIPSSAAETCPEPAPMMTDVRFSDDHSTAAPSSIELMAWFEGHWIGEVFGLKVEHIVLSASGDDMPGLVRLEGDEGAVIYELSSFLIEDGQLIYRNRLFDPALDVSPGPDGDVMSRSFIAAEEDTVFFDGITFARQNETCSVVSFILAAQDGNPEKHIVRYTRKSK